MAMDTTATVMETATVTTVTGMGTVTGMETAMVTEMETAMVTATVTIKCSQFANIVMKLARDSGLCDLEKY